MEDLKQIQEFFSKPVNEYDSPFVVHAVAKAYKDYIKAKKDSAADVDFAEDPEKAYRYYLRKLNNTYSTRADRDAIEAVLKQRYGSTLEENTTNWPKEVPSRYGDIIFRLVKVMPDRAKYELIDAETGKTWEVGGRVYGTVNQLKASAEDTIKPQGGRQSSHFGVNEAFTPSSIFKKDPNNPNFLKITIPYDVGSGFSTALGKRTMSGQTRDMGSKTAMIKANQIAKQLESMFDLEDIDVTDQQNGKVEIFAVSDDFENKSSSEIKAELNTLMNEEKIEVDKDTKFQLDLTHLLDKHVVKEIAEEVMKKKGYSKYLVSKDNPKGETPGLTDDVLSKILMKIGDEVKETIELGKNLEEGKLCPKGEAYRKRRIAAGEKSSAYLSGRAVKVCKGQMSGKKK